MPANQMFFVGTATIDLTNSDLTIFQQWFTTNIVTITSLTPAVNAVPIWFVAASSIPGGVAASGVTMTSIVDLVI